MADGPMPLRIRLAEALHEAANLPEYNLSQRMMTVHGSPHDSSYLDAADMILDTAPMASLRDDLALDGHVRHGEVLGEHDRLRQAVGDYLHQRICDAPPFGDTRCARCAALHDPACRQKDPTAPHETRWCDGNTVSVTERAMAEALSLGGAADLALTSVGGTDG